MQRKVRTFLNILSILIGIAAVFALVSFSEGLEWYVQDNFEKLGGDKVIVFQKGGIGEDNNVMISDQDFNFLKKQNDIIEATGFKFKSAEITFKKEREIPWIIGLETAPEDVRMLEDMSGIEIMEGRALKEGDKLNVVLGYRYTKSNDIFKKRIKLNDNIEIGNISLDVIGFYDKVGNPDDDRNVYVSMDGYESLFPDDESYTQLIGQVAPRVDPGAFAEKFEEKFRKFRNQKEGQEDFTVDSVEDLMETFNNILGILQGVLMGIVLISVLVATVNIMNTMFTAVLERTQEIGVMKAIGAENNTIMLVFLIESSIIGFMGSAAGVLIGWMLASMGGSVLVALNYDMLKPIFPFWLIASCLIAGTLVGTVAGLMPARRASLLKPVDSLRYE